MRIVRTTADENEELKFLVSSIKNDTRYHTPDLAFVKECEQKLMVKLQLMGALRSEDKPSSWVSQQQSGGALTLSQSFLVANSVERRTTPTAGQRVPAFGVNQPARQAPKRATTPSAGQRVPATPEENVVK